MASQKCSSHEERDLALYALHGIISIIGDSTKMTVDLWQLHRIILAMQGVAMEADQQLSFDADFDRVATLLARMLVAEATEARRFRQENGIGLMDLALQTDRDLH